MINTNKVLTTSQPQPKRTAPNGDLSTSGVRTTPITKSPQTDELRI